MTGESVRHLQVIRLLSLSPPPHGEFKFDTQVKLKMLHYVQYSSMM